MHKWLSFLPVLACLVIAKAVAATNDYGSSQTWVERPWEYRYFLSIRGFDSFVLAHKLWEKELRNPELKYSQIYEGMFDYSQIATIRPSENATSKPIAKLLIEFDTSGQVTTRHSGPSELTGRLSRNHAIVLTAGNTSNDRLFYLGDWYNSRRGKDIAVTPAICSIDDLERRYKKGFKAHNTQIGNFGCREWDYYLKSDKHPYIDITSYQLDVDYDKLFMVPTEDKTCKSRAIVKSDGSVFPDDCESIEKAVHPMKRVAYMSSPGRLIARLLNNSGLSRCQCFTACSGV